MRLSSSWHHQEGHRLPKSQASKPIRSFHPLLAMILLVLPPPSTPFFNARTWGRVQSSVSGRRFCSGKVISCQPMRNQRCPCSQSWPPPYIATHEPCHQISLAPLYNDQWGLAAMLVTGKQWKEYMNSDLGICQKPTGELYRIIPPTSLPSLLYTHCWCISLFQSMNTGQLLSNIKMWQEDKKIIIYNIKNNRIIIIILIVIIIKIKS